MITIFMQEVGYKKQTAGVVSATNTHKPRAASERTLERDFGWPKSKMKEANLGNHKLGSSRRLLGLAKVQVWWKFIKKWRSYGYKYAF